MSDERCLVTGAMGCIGSWALRHLVSQGRQAVVLDQSAEARRPALLLSSDELSRVRFLQGDIGDLETVCQIVRSEQISQIVHLAALQVPFCRADPSLGARVNVVGTVNVFEAARRSEGKVRNVVYASSIAVFGAPEDYPEGPLAAHAGLHPTTLYGVYKQANEGTARLYWQDWKVPSVGLRPAVVFGVARDQGLTSSPTKAMLAAALGRPYHIPFGGMNMMQWASDVGAIFLQAADSSFQGAEVFHFGGAAMPMGEVVSAIEAAAPEARGTISYEDKQLPFPFEFGDEAIEAAIGRLPRTPFRESVASTVEAFRALAAAGKVDETGLA